MDKKVKYNKFKIGKLTFTLPNNKPTDKLFQQWKQEFLEKSESVFESTLTKKEPEEDTDKLYTKIGKLEMENDFLKKNLKKLGHI